MNAMVAEAVKSNKPALVGIAALILAMVTFGFIVPIFTAAADKDASPNLASDLREPLPENISWKNEPIMWDFQNGTFGWHNGVNTYNVAGGHFYALAVKTADLSSESGTIWISEYAGTDPQPPTGKESQSVKKSGDDWVVTASTIANAAPERSFTEGEWTFILIPQSGLGYDDNVAFTNADGADTWRGVTLNVTAEETVTVKEFKTITGWPTDWLRLYADSIARSVFVDINDPFWDTYRYGALYRMDAVESKEGMADSITVRCADVDTFELPGGMTLTEEALNVPGEFQTIEEAAAADQWGDPEAFAA